MDTKKVLSIISVYEDRLSEEGVLKIRMDPKRTFHSLSRYERLAHAYYLCDGIRQNIYTAGEGKIGRHLAAVQMCLSFAGWYTLEELMDHNRP